ncbi:uncharacterized protein LOC144144205 isoform X3 [Haemaphysalis longicornis]
MHTVDLTSSQLAVLCCVVGSCECCVHRLFPGPAAVGLVARQGRLRACRLCAYVTTASSSMTTHLRTHTGERPYGCPFCPSAFAQSANLKRHVRTHTGERPFACFHCPSSFAQKSDLRSHLRLHTGERPYRSSRCRAMHLALSAGSIDKITRPHSDSEHQARSYTVRPVPAAVPDAVAACQPPPGLPGGAAAQGGLPPSGAREEPPPAALPVGAPPGPSPLSGLQHRHQDETCPATDLRDD